MVLICISLKPNDFEHLLCAYDCLGGFFLGGEGVFISFLRHMCLNQNLRLSPEIYIFISSEKVIFSS